MNSSSQKSASEALIAVSTRKSARILAEFLEHGKAVRAERARASAAGEKPNFVQLVRSWGGVSIVYRKRLVDSPAYRLNHEEVIKALEEGISFIEDMSPEEAIVDDANHVRAMRFRTKNREVELPARSVMVAAGTTPNITYEKEHSGTFQLDSKKKFFAPHRIKRNGEAGFALEPASGADAGAFFTSYSQGWPLYQLLRRQPPAVRRKCRKSYGIGARRLSICHGALPG